MGQPQFRASSLATRLESNAKVEIEAGIVLSLFLIFSDFEPRCSYKIVLIKKECKLH